MLGYIDIAIVILEIFSSIYNSSINDWSILKGKVIYEYSNTKLP